MNAFLLIGLKYLGNILLAMLVQVLTGRTLKRIIVIIGEKLSRKTKSKIDDKILKDIEKDFNLEDK